MLGPLLCPLVLPLPQLALLLAHESDVVLGYFGLLGVELVARAVQVLLHLLVQSLQGLVLGRELLQLLDFLEPGVHQVQLATDGPLLDADQPGGVHLRQLLDLLLAPDHSLLIASAIRPG